MCELLGLSSRKKITVNSYLREFFSHSEIHCHGWGLALFYQQAVSLEKEAIAANQSQYLHQRIAHPIMIDNMIAHIRLASVGRMFYENCHPFVKHDNRGRSWTLAHNGTLFKAPHLDLFQSVQEGQTDSERILYYLVDEVNKLQDELGWPLTPEERFRLLDDLITRLSVDNKLNLLLWDGEYMYVHTNYRGTLHLLRKDAETCGLPPSRSTTARGRPCPSCSCWSFARDDWSMKARVAARSILIRKRTLNTSTWILLICNGSAIHLYEAFGFVQIPGFSEQFVRGDYLMAKGV